MRGLPTVARGPSMQKTQNFIHVHYFKDHGDEVIAAGRC